VIRFRCDASDGDDQMSAKEISVEKYVVRLNGEEREQRESLLHSKARQLA
jgi:hypothetical protein